MTPAVFDKLFELHEPLMERNNTNYREAVLARHRLFAILRYLSTGDTMQTIATSFGLGYLTVWNILRNDLKLVWKKLQPIYLPVSKHYPFFVTIIDVE